MNKCKICGRENCMSISPSYCIKHWELIREDLPLDNNNANWHLAIGIMDDRITNRFLKQIEQLEKNLDSVVRVYSGFSIMSIACLLIETLNQFREGLADTNEKYRSESWKTFRDFFQQSSAFHDHFAPFSDDKRNSKSGVFYDQIRCGLLHQAETKACSKIRTDYGAMVSWVYETKPNLGLLINREFFRKALVLAFKEYKEKLLDVSNVKLRKNFIQKMDLICRIEKVFSYGSNMWSKRIQARIKDYKCINIAYLNGYKLVCNKKSIDGSSKANIEKSTNPQDRVYGIVQELGRFQKKLLDHFEGSAYITKKITVFYVDGTNEEVNCYLVTKRENKDNERLPYHWYKKYILQGAVENELPNNYIDQIETIESIEDPDEERRDKNWEMINS